MEVLSYAAGRPHHKPRRAWLALGRTSATTPTNTTTHVARPTPMTVPLVMTAANSRHNNAPMMSGNTFGNAHAPLETVRTRSRVQHHIRYPRGVPHPLRIVELVAEAAVQVQVAEAEVRVAVVRDTMSTSTGMQRTRRCMTSMVRYSAIPPSSSQACSSPSARSAIRNSPLPSTTSSSSDIPSARMQMARGDSSARRMYAVAVDESAACPPTTSPRPPISTRQRMRAIVHPRLRRRTLHG